ncbi:PPE family protein [Mycobacterium haemophilum]|nr:PPE family protein [Mycobacterium haemophilum]
MHYNFQAIPPEVNSANIFGGPGPDSMYAAANKWAKLADQMAYAPGLFGEVLSLLNEKWSGPAAMQMAQAAAPYRAWLTTLIRQITETAAVAFRIMDAYAAACKAAVDPDDIDYNREQRMALIASQRFGEYAEAIAQLDAEYLKFWAEDAMTMETYAAEVLDALSELTPWQQPPEITNEAELV